MKTAATYTFPDPGSLTAIEYEGIYNTLCEYCRVAEKIPEPEYLHNVRMAKLPHIRKIIKKMEARMTEFPPDFVS